MVLRRILGRVLGQGVKRVCIDPNERVSEAELYDIIDRCGMHEDVILSACATRAYLNNRKGVMLVLGYERNPEFAPGVYEPFIAFAFPSTNGDCEILQGEEVEVEVCQ